MIYIRYTSDEEERFQMGHWCEYKVFEDGITDREIMDYGDELVERYQGRDYYDYMLETFGEYVSPAEISGFFWEEITEEEYKEMCVD